MKIKPITLEKIFPAYARRLSRYMLGISGSYFVVVSVPKGSGEIGYTGAGKKIFVSYDNPILDGIPTIEGRLQFIKGVCLHELMHQIETDFDETNRIVEKKPSTAQKRIFMTIANAIEDPAIEYHAPRYMAEDALDALHFQVKTIYSQHEILDEAAPPFIQYINALIQYGDGGLLKGSFSSAEAKDMFIKTIPLIDMAIEEPVGARRLRIADEVFELTRPLWEASAKEQEELEEFLKKMMSSLGKSFASGSAESKAVSSLAKSLCGKGSGEADAEQETVKKRRKVTFRKVSKEEAEDLMGSGSGSSGSIPPEGDIEVLIVDDGDKESSGSDESKGSSSSGKGSKSEESSSEGSSSEGSETGSSGDKSAESSGESDSDSGSSEPKSESMANSPGIDATVEKSYTSSDSKGGTSGIAAGGVRISYDTPGGEIKGADSDESSADEIDELSYELSDEEAEAIAEDIKECLSETTLEEREEKSSESLEVPDLKGKYPKVKCLNKTATGNVNESMMATYDSVVSKMKPGIRRLSEALMRIFRNDTEDISYRDSGRICIKRLSNARLTTSIFTKRIEPSNKANMAVLLAIDCSGSMWGRKINLARECAIGLAESFAAINVPLKIIGFTADTEGYDAVHYHFVNWKKGKRERVRLLEINANSDNFDGYSIRYAGKILARRPEANKLMIVISDGQPACYYYDGRAGIADTKSAIRDVKKSGIKLIGVAIDADTSVLRSMYGNSFLKVTDLNKMFSAIEHKIRREVSANE